MNWNEYGAFIIEETKNLLAIDSPSGMTKKAAEHVAARFEALGYAPQTTRKGRRARLPRRPGSGKRPAAGGAHGYPSAAWSARSRRTGG